MYDDKSMFIYGNFTRTLLGVVVGEQVGVDVSVVGASLTGAGAGNAVGDDVSLLRLLSIHIDLQGDLGHDVNVVIGVLHSHTVNPR